MTNSTTQVTKPTSAYKLASIVALLLGSVSYSIGLINAELQLNEKGYFLIILLYGLFAFVSVQKSVRDKIEGVPVSKVYNIICWASVAIVLLLMTIGLFNAPLALSEKGFFAMSFVLSLFAAVTVQKNIRDNLLHEEVAELDATN